jgi:hypothetical protein
MTTNPTMCPTANTFAGVAVDAVRALPPRPREMSPYRGVDVVGSPWSLCVRASPCLGCGRRRGAPRSHLDFLSSRKGSTQCLEIFDTCSTVRLPNAGVHILYTPSARHTQQEPHARFCLCANSCSRTHTSCTVNHYNASPHCLHLVLTLVPNTRPVASLARGPASSRAHACPPLSHIYLASPPVHTTAACLERTPTMVLPTTSAPSSPNVPLRLAWPQHQ